MVANPIVGEKIQSTNKNVNYEFAVYGRERPQTAANNFIWCVFTRRVLSSKDFTIE